MNPTDNAENLPAEYIEGLEAMSSRYKRRFLHGEFAEAAPNALFPDEHMDRWRTDGELPDMQRVVVAVDPSGSGDEDNADNDAIGIVVAGLGTDGIAYLLEDLTVKAGPATWGRIATNAYDRHKADLIVAEINYGGAMVKQVIKAARPNTPYREVTASRGKVVRAEPVAALCETGKIRLAGRFPDLEDELSGFTTGGYVGANSPNRADAFVWAMSELFPGMVKQETKPKERYKPPMMTGGWMR
jgi:predicted phage terminase large subunit-like protein